MTPRLLWLALLLLTPSIAEAADCIDTSCLCVDSPVPTVLRTTVTQTDGPRTLVGVNEEIGEDGPVRAGDSMALPRGEGDEVGRRILVFMRGADVIGRVGLNDRDEAVCDDHPDFALAEMEAITAARTSREDCQALVSARGYVPLPCPCGCASAGPEPLLAAALALASLRLRRR